METFIIVYAAVTLIAAQFMDWTSRAAGGGVGAGKVAGGTPERMFAIPIALAGGLFLYTVTTWIWSFAFVPLFWGWVVWGGMERGHTRVYPMGGVAEGSAKAPSTIERLGPQWFWERVLKRSIHSQAYSVFIMRIKGLLIGLPLGPFALLMAYGWAKAYWLAFRWDGFRDDGSSEWLSGGFARMIVTLTVLCSVYLLLAERLGA